MRSVISILLIFILFGCQGGESRAEISNSKVMTGMAATYELASEGEVETSTQIESDKIIKNAVLRFESVDLEQTNKKLVQTVQKYKGQISSEQEWKDEYAYNRNLSIRVPSAKFDDVLQEISTMVSYFDTKNVSSEDMTRNYIDIAARMKTKKELENRYLQLLNKASKVSEMLEIEKELTSVREEIESMQAQLNYIQNQADMSTIDVSFYKFVPRSDTMVSAQYGQKLWAAILSGIDMISDTFLFFIGIWPFIILLIISVFVIRKYRRNKKRIKSN